MAADLMQHVIEKRHTCTGLTAAAPVKPEPNADIGLARNAVNLPSAHPFVDARFALPMDRFCALISLDLLGASDPLAQPSPTKGPWLR